MSALVVALLLAPGPTETAPDKPSIEIIGGQGAAPSQPTTTDDEPAPTQPPPSAAAPAKPAPEVSSAPPDPANLFVQGNQAYAAGNFEVAIEAYRAIVAQGPTGAAVYYNLGNAYLRTSRLGQAIASYRRAQQLTPRDENLRANLSFAHKSSKDDLRPPGPAPIVQTILFWHFALSRAELLAALVLANLLLWGGLLARVFRPGSETLRWAVVVAFIAVFGMAGSLAYKTLLPVRVAVVSTPEMSVHSGTDRDTVVRFKLHAGAEVRVVEEHAGGWLRVRLPDGKQGWVSPGDVEVVEI